MREWLNDQMKENIGGLSNIEEFHSLFEQTVEKILDVLGTEVFKIKGRTFNRSVFDAIMVSFASGMVNCNFKDDLIQEYHSLLEDPGFKISIIEGTTDPKKVKSRINLALDYFLE